MKIQAKSIFFIEINSKQGEKKKISPVGVGVQGFDGRTFDIDGDKVLEFQRQQGLDIYIDEDHRAGKAQGWIYLNTLELREDGIYADVEYTPEGQALVDNKSYRYFSPTYIMGDNRQVLGIEAVALCNTPNLLNKAINTKENTEMTPEEIKALINEHLQAFKEQLLAELKESAPAGNADVEQAVEEVKAVVEEVKETAAEVKEAAKEVEELKEEILEANKQSRSQRIEAAIKDGKITANQREFALSLNSKQFAEFEKLNGFSMEHLKKAVEIEKNNKGQPDEVDAKIAEMLGLKEK